MLPQIRIFPLSLRKSAAVGALALATLLPTSALADGARATVVDVLTPRLEIASNGSSYTGASASAKLEANVRIRVSTEAVGLVKSWSMWLGLQRAGYTPLWFHQYTIGKSYPWYDRPDRVDRVERFSVPSSAWSNLAMLSCNDLAADLRTQGLSDTAIFAEDRSLQMALPVDLKADTTGAGSSDILIEGSFSWENQKKVEIVCKKWSGFSVPQASSSLTTQEATVVDTSLAVAETAGLSGVCKIRINGAIATDHLNVDVRFRYKDKAGNESRVWTVNTGAAKFVSFSHWYDIPNGRGPETGSVRMVGVSHQFQSQWADYEMNCVDGGPSALSTDVAPKLTIKAVEEEGTVMMKGQFCPERLRLVGEVEGGGNHAGYAAFLTTSAAFWISPPQAYDLDDGETQQVVGYYPLWRGITMLLADNSPIIREYRFVFRATDSKNAIVASRDFMHVVKCKPPTRNPAVGGTAGDIGVQPRQPAAPTAAPRMQQQQTQPVSPTPQIILPRRQLRQAN